MNVIDSSFVSSLSTSKGIWIGLGNVFSPVFTNSELSVKASLWSTSSDATLSVTGDNSRFTGYTTMEPVSKINALLRNNSSWTITRSSDISTLTNNASVVGFTKPQGSPTDVSNYKTLTILDGYVSQNGVIALNTYLAGDDSPTDKIIFNNSSNTGQSALRIVNNGGQGATTTQGIRVVQAINGGTTKADAFHLDPLSSNYRASSSTLAFNGFEYSLVRGGRNPSEDDWFLDAVRATSKPTPPPTPTPTPEPEPEDFNVSPELGSYVGNNLAATQLFQHSLYERDAGRVTDADDRFGKNVWGRIKGSRDTNTKLTHGRTDIDTNSYVMQLGTDLLRRQTGENGVLIGGVMAGYGQANINSHSDIYASSAGIGREIGITSKGRVKGFSVGAYATWHDNEITRLGPYVDTWLQFGRYSNKITGQIDSADYHANLWSVSAESGYTFKPIDSSNLLIQPKAQAIYSRYSADDAKLSGLTMRQKGGNQVDTRVGVRVYPWGNSVDSNTFRPYIEADWRYRSGTPGTRVGTNTFDVKPLRHAAELQLGTEGRIGKATYMSSHVFGHVGTHNQRGFGGMVNVNYNW